MFLTLRVARRSFRRRRWCRTRRSPGAGRPCRRWCGGGWPWAWFNWKKILPKILPRILPKILATVLRKRVLSSCQSPFWSIESGWLRHYWKGPSFLVLWAGFSAGFSAGFFCLLNWAPGYTFNFKFVRKPKVSVYKWKLCHKGLKPTPLVDISYVSKMCKILF